MASGDVYNFEVLQALVDKLVHECNKTALICSQENAPDQLVQVSLADVQTTLSVFETISSSATQLSGKYQAKNIHDSLEGLITSVNNFASCCKEKQPRLIEKCGILSEYQQKIRECPKNEKNAVLCYLKNYTLLIDDALNELNEVDDELEEAVDLNGSQEIENARRVDNCKQLIKVPKAILNKMIDVIDTVDYNSRLDEDLDEVAALCEKISPAVDDLICCLYQEPTNQQLGKHVMDLYETCNAALNRFRQSEFGISDIINQRCDFLMKALKHNTDKFMVEN